MHVASIYTVFSQRCGAEMLSEQLMATATDLFPEIHWTVFCNRPAEAALRKFVPGVTRIYVPWLDNQFAKAFWLEFLAAGAVNALHPDVFWNPSGCNHFPGRWNVPTVTTFLDLAEYRVKAKYDFKRRFFRRRLCIPRSLRRSAAFTAISRFTADDLARFLGLDSGVSVVYCGPSPHPKSSRPATAGRPDISAEVPSGRYFLVPGRTDFEGKGLDVLLSAHDGLGEDWPDGVQVVFVGPPGTGHHRFLERLRKSDAGRSRLLYLGRVEEDVLESLYAHALATVIPSRSEGFGFPVLEAMEHGVPVICSDAGSLPEVAGDAARIFASGDAMALAEEMKRLAADPSLRRELVERGRGQYRRFSWERCAREMMAIFQAAGALPAALSPDAGGSI